MLRLFDAFKREDGQTMAEYGVVLAVITIAVFSALALLSGNIVNAGVVPGMTAEICVPSIITR